MISSKTDSNTFLDFQESRFSDAEKTQIISEIKQWNKSSDVRKKQFADTLKLKWFASARDGNEILMDRMLSLRMVDINQKNRFGFSALLVAVQNHQGN